MNTMDKIFENRKNFIIIGLTGRTACGCTTCGKILSHEFDDLEIEKCSTSSNTCNENRKNKIIYDYARVNWKPFYYIKISDIITSFLLEHNWEDVNSYLLNEFNVDLQNKIDLQELMKKFYIDWNQKYSTLKQSFDKTIRDSFSKTVLNQLEELKIISEYIKKTLNYFKPELYTQVYQKIGDNIRKYGSAIPNVLSQPDVQHIYTLISRVNEIIKTIKSEKNKFVIDAIRNPIEAIYFKERYSAFYLLAINSTKSDRHDRLMTNINYSLQKIEELDKKESADLPDGTSEFDILVSQNIPECLQKADIHIVNAGIAANKSYVDLTTQLVRYAVLIEHPGLITPTADERIMQIAFTAKESSCCISRKVGAVVISGNNKIEGIGWNDVPEGQTGCSLRNTDDLLKCFDKNAYSKYELENDKFRFKVREMYKNDAFTEKSGLPKAYCFKKIKNKVDANGNQVHTRALHAEENAFLQCAKKGGVPLKGGTLFSTASPCELCAKKAYQLGLMRIVYIDPYPGISEDHIFNCGEVSYRPRIELFSGAIGQAYFKLYSSILPYKDELDARLKDYKNTDK